jgi:DeoR family fructose operon transcriptional repressor
MTPTPTTAHERQQALQSLLEEHGSVVVSQLARTWGVSEMTVRRDLQALEKIGLASRVHGGAVAAGALRWRARADRARAEKERAAQQLVQYLPERGTIYLDGSTTVSLLVSALHEHAGLRVATNTPETFQALLSCPGLEPVLIGGKLNRKTDNLVGPLARAAIAKLAFDAAFFSAYGLDPELGPCEPSLEDSEIKELVCARAEQHYFAINHQKLGRRAAGVWQLPSDTVVACDLAADHPDLQPYQKFFPAFAA